ncbi:MAG: hypothetical protein J2P37_14175 [Ktedonobacteraceae bacterium]|nr:hypothetical protein [Ktedonobacteraceae bacterium]MBO0789512.1 hypothetical protein [Ktedonobacteraceae bacterium]
MWSKENGAERPESRALPASRKPLKLVLGFLLGLVPGISIILLLLIFKHSGWFALLGGFFGMLLYDGLVFVEWLFGRSLGRKKTPQRQDIVGEAARQAFVALVWPWLLIYGLLAIGAGVGLFGFSRQQSPLFALISGALSLLFCISVFRWGMMAGLSVLILFVLPKGEKRLEPPPDEGERTGRDKREY